VQALWDFEGFDQMSADPASDAPLKRTPLYAEHVALGAKMVPFAGYEMPVQYPLGILKEHLATRAQAGLFDVSHMGQAMLTGPDHASTAAALEALIPADIVNLATGRQRYSQLLTDAGGIIDDLMVTRPAGLGSDGRLMLVVNASRKDVDYAHIASRLPASVKLLPAPERALLAGVARARDVTVEAANAVGLWRQLLKDDALAPVGLGARDSLRLEAGLCLYGHDIDETTSPIEAGLAWSIQKRRRVEGGFPGARRIQDELANGPKRRRVGIRPEGRAPARERTDIQSPKGERIGVVTSGGFGPSVNGPVAMGYVEAAHAKLGTPLSLMVRGKALPAAVAPLPFAPHRYARKT